MVDHCNKVVVHAGDSAAEHAADQIDEIGESPTLNCGLWCDRLHAGQLRRLLNVVTTECCTR